jgi:hypothetical protein
MTASRGLGPAPPIPILLNKWSHDRPAQRGGQPLIAALLTARRGLLGHPAQEAARPLVMSLLSRAARTARAIRAAVAQPPFVAPGHFYSPMTSLEDIRHALAWEAEAPGVDLNAAGQLALARELESAVSEGPPGPRWTAGPENHMFGSADASVYRAMLGWLHPKRIIEVGSGFSTAIALDEGYAVTCIEPYPERLLSLTRPGDPVTLLKQPVQDALCPFKH